MTKSIQTVITPLLIISYVAGLRIFEFPIRNSRIWFGLLYMLIFWSIYFFLLKFIAIAYLNNKNFTIDFFICTGIDILVTLMSIIFNMYYDKKFKNCLKKLDIVDNTLQNIGITTDYSKLHKKIIYLILGWLLIILTNYVGGNYKKNDYNYDFLTILYTFLMQNYCFHINMINDLILISIFGYIGLKFDQINQHFLHSTKDNKCGVKRAWENSMHRRRFLRALNNEWIIWVIIHLHSELRQISCEIDSIFGVQMTLQMGCNFCWIAYHLRELFSLILINNYVKSNKVLYIVMMLIYIFYDGLKLFLINYICETVSTKANATRNLIYKVPYFTCDVEVRKNISQFLLQITQAPVRFFGIGLFQYGYKFFYGFSSSIATIVVLLTQGYIKKQRNDD